MASTTIGPQLAARRGHSSSLLGCAGDSASSMPFATASSADQRSPITRVAWLSLGSLVSGLLQRSMVFARGLEVLPHHVSHLCTQGGVRRRCSRPWARRVAVRRTRATPLEASGWAPRAARSWAGPAKATSE